MNIHSVMLNNPYFHTWVANTIDGLGGSGVAYLQGLQRECALTFVESGVNACQGGFDDSDERFSAYLMPFSVRVTANLMTIH